MMSLEWAVGKHGLADGVAGCLAVVLCCCVEVVGRTRRRKSVATLGSLLAQVLVERVVSECGIWIVGGPESPGIGSWKGLLWLGVLASLRWCREGRRRRWFGGCVECRQRVLCWLSCSG